MIIIIIIMTIAMTRIIIMIMKGLRVARGWIRQDLAADSESTLTSAQGSCRLISIQMIIKTLKMMAMMTERKERDDNGDGPDHECAIKAL